MHMKHRQSTIPEATWRRAGDRECVIDAFYQSCREASNQVPKVNATLPAVSLKPAAPYLNYCGPAVLVVRISCRGLERAFPALQEKCSAKIL